jgi:hypothetical protein
VGGATANADDIMSLYECMARRFRIHIVLVMVLADKTLGFSAGTFATDR